MPYAFPRRIFGFRAVLLYSTFVANAWSSERNAPAAPPNATQPSSAPAANVAALSRTRTPRCSSNPESDLKRGRKLASQGKWAQAIASYDPAIHASPANAVLRAERGYALYRLGELDKARTDLLLALGLETRGAVLAATHFNMGILEQKEANPEQARLHFAAASALGNKAAAQKLGGQSMCRATITRTPKLADAPLAASLTELAAVACPELQRPTTEQEAKRQLCSECYPEILSSKSKCELKFPLKIVHNFGGRTSMPAISLTAELVPQSDHKYIYSFFDSTSVTWPEWQVHKEFLLVQYRDVALEILSDGLGNEPVQYFSSAEYYTTDTEDGAHECHPNVDDCHKAGDRCYRHEPGTPYFVVETLRSNRFVVYSLASKKPLLAVKGFNEDLKVSLKDGQLHVTSAGCDESIDLTQH